MTHDPQSDGANDLEVVEAVEAEKVVAAIVVVVYSGVEVGEHWF